MEFAIKKFSVQHLCQKHLKKRHLNSWCLGEVVLIIFILDFLDGLDVEKNGNFNELKIIFQKFLAISGLFPIENYQHHLCQKLLKIRHLNSWCLGEVVLIILYDFIINNIFWEFCTLNSIYKSQHLSFENSLTKRHLIALWNVICLHFVFALFLSVQKI